MTTGPLLEDMDAIWRSPKCTPSPPVEANVNEFTGVAEYVHRLHVSWTRRPWSKRNPSREWPLRTESTSTAASSSSRSTPNDMSPPPTYQVSAARSRAVARSRPPQTVVGRRLESRSAQPVFDANRYFCQGNFRVWGAKKLVGSSKPRRLQRFSSSPAQTCFGAPSPLS